MVGFGAILIKTHQVMGGELPNMPIQKNIKITDLELADILLSAHEGTQFSMLCTGSSMLPTFLDRKSIAYLEIGEPDCVMPGDIVLFARKNRKLVLHRVMRINSAAHNKQSSESLLVMNGDAQDWYENISKSQIIAKVVAYRRNGENDKLVDCSSIRYRVLSLCRVRVKPIIIAFHRIRKLPQRAIRKIKH